MPSDLVCWQQSGHGYPAVRSLFQLQTLDTDRLARLHFPHPFVEESLQPYSYEVWTFLIFSAPTLPLGPPKLVAFGIESLSPFGFGMQQPRALLSECARLPDPTTGSTRP